MYISQNAGGFPESGNPSDCRETLKLCTSLRASAYTGVAIPQIERKSANHRTEMFGNPRDCHVGLRPPRNDVRFQHAESLNS